MGIISEEMTRVVREQRLGYAATVCPDGTPNLSPKGTTAFWDADRLIFADIRSPRTVENLRHNPAIEVNVVDPISRKGYRFKGTGTVLTEGDLFDEALEFYRERGVQGEIREVGAGLLPAANAVRALDELGLSEKVRRLGIPASSARILSWRGETLTDVPADELEKMLGAPAPPSTGPTSKASCCGSLARRTCSWTRRARVSSRTKRALRPSSSTARRNAGMP
jgi:uncharacterized protein